MWPWTASTMGEVYLFHFHQPLGNTANRRAQASHYVGFSDDLEARIAAQLAGKGAKLVAAALARGITYELYHWPACLAVEKLIKRTKKTALYCPTCCAAAHRPVRPLPVPVVQLALPLDEVEPWTEELPDVPARSIDWYEISYQRRWRAARVLPVGDLDALDDLL